MVDVEADGPIPGLYSMISFGAVIVEPNLNKTFYGELKPISGKWVPEALAVSGFSRAQTMEFDNPSTVMCDFNIWLKENCDKESHPWKCPECLKIWQDSNSTNIEELWGMK